MFCVCLCTYVQVYKQTCTYVYIVPFVSFYTHIHLSAFGCFLFCVRIIKCLYTYTLMFFSLFVISGYMYVHRYIYPRVFPCSKNIPSPSSEKIKVHIEGNLKNLSKQFLSVPKSILWEEEKTMDPDSWVSYP